jgi:nucleotide-binding universal stress UspA family protein
VIRGRELAMAGTGSGADTYKVIVVGTDGSDRAQIAFDEALMLSKLSGATLHIVHAVHGAAKSGFVDVMGEAQFKARESRDQVDEIGRRLVEEAERAGVSAELHNPDTDAAEALIKTAEAVDADLVVLGNRGMTGKSRFLLGNVPNKVSHNCPCSLMIVNTDRG